MGKLKLCSVRRWWEPQKHWLVTKQQTCPDELKSLILCRINVQYTEIDKIRVNVSLAGCHSPYDTKAKVCTWKPHSLETVPAVLPISPGNKEDTFHMATGECS